MTSIELYVIATDLRAAINPTARPELAPLHQALIDAAPFLAADVEAELARAKSAKE
jgi:hypothetical protein